MSNISGQWQWWVVTNFEKLQLLYNFLLFPTISVLFSIDKWLSFTKNIGGEGGGAAVTSGIYKPAYADIT